MLGEDEVSAIIKDFPQLELSYETITHNKVYDADYAILIPEGMKCYAWFTTYKSDNVCFLLETTNRNQITKVSIVQTGFKDVLAFGTIFYGTIFYSYNKEARLNTRCITIEDVYQYRGTDCFTKPYSQKLEILNTIFEKNELSQYAHFKSYTVFGLPLIIDASLDDAMDDIHESHTIVPYKIKCIHYRFSNTRKIWSQRYGYGEQRKAINYTSVTYSLNNKKIETNNNTKTFLVKPDIQNDIYYIYDLNDNTKKIDLLCIPDYTTSVYMNGLFRKIKENINLDNLEASDDEEEFENADVDKFVYLDRELKMKCSFNNKFKKWSPINC